MSPRLSLAFFGLCQRGVTELRQLACQPGISISWIVEQDLKFAEKVAQCLPPHCDTHIIKPSYAHLIYEDPTVDAVLVCFPYSGVNWVRRALSHGKGVFCESPMLCRDMGAILACHEISEAIDRPLMFFLKSRFDSFMNRAREMIDGGEIGKIDSVKTKSSTNLSLSFCDAQTTDEGILGSTLPGLDQVCWLIKEDPVTVHVRQTPPQSTTDHVFHSVHNRPRLPLSPQQTTSSTQSTTDHVFHSVHVDLCFPSGAIGTVEVNREGEAHDDQLEVCGSEGKLFVKAGKSVMSQRYNDPHRQKEVCVASGANQNTALMAAILHFLDVTRGSDTTKIPVIDVLRLSVVAAACELSLRSDKLVEVADESFHKDSLLEKPIWKDRPDVY